jgi:hypothetical protein
VSARAGGRRGGGGGGGGGGGLTTPKKERYSYECACVCQTSDADWLSALPSAKNLLSHATTVYNNNTFRTEICLFMHTLAHHHSRLGSPVKNVVPLG